MNCAMIFVYSYSCILYDILTFYTGFVWFFLWQCIVSYRYLRLNKYYSFSTPVCKVVTSKYWSQWMNLLHALRPYAHVGFSAPAAIWIEYCVSSFHNNKMLVLWKFFANSVQYMIEAILYSCKKVRFTHLLQNI